MPPGKLAAQAGHAFLETFLNAQREQPDQAARYAADPPGTKVCLAVTIAQLEHAYQQARAAGIPCSLITDSGHVLLPDFDGSPIITALGIGPATRERVGHITRQLALTA